MACADEYLRPVDALLLFPGGEMLLLSEREADSLQELMWQSGAAARPVLLRACYARLACYAHSRPMLALPGSVRSPFLLSVSVPEVVAYQLFNGETVFGDRGSAQYRELHRLMERRKEAAQALVGLRGKQALLPCSDLERACEEWWDK